MKATTRVNYEEPKDPREIEAVFLTETGNKARVTYVWAETEMCQSMKYPVESFFTIWSYELEWDV